MRDMKRELPKGWRWVKLGGKHGIAEIINGSTPSTDEPAYWNGDILWATPTDLGKLDSIYIEDTERKITLAGLESCSTKLLPVGTVLLTSRAPVGNIAITKKPLCTNQGFKSFVPKEGIYSPYLYFAIKMIVPEIQKQSHGNTFVEITKDLIKHFEIPLPPTIDDQIAIANELEQKMTEVENMRQAALRQKEAGDAIQEAILKKFFPYKDGDRLPQDWRWVNLGDIAELKNGINFNSSQVGSGTLTLDVFNMYSQDIHPILNNLYRVNTSSNEHYLLKNNDILFVRSSVKKEGVGWPTAFQGYDEPVTFCGFLIRARLLKTDICAPYLVYYFRKNSVRESFISASGQSTITNINQESLKKVLIPVPSSIDKQISIANDVKKKLLEVDQMRQTIEKQHDAIEAMPGAILREVFDFGKN